MPDSAEAAVTALAGSTTEIVGRFQYDVTSQKWWWSPSLYTIHGFTPGEIVPTTALMIAHQHPDDQACGVDMITAAIATGTPFCSRHRIVDARQRVHTVVTIGEGIRDSDGRIVMVSGYIIDVTNSLHRDLAKATQQAVEQSAESRAAIEQAKGALMITYGLDDDEAFALLRWHSQHNNIKLRDIAAGITDRSNDPSIAELPAAGKIAEILTNLADPEADPEPAPASGPSKTWSAGTDERLSA